MAEQNAFRTQPLLIAALEDKIVQRALADVLNAICWRMERGSQWM
jgi:hypothetical protein